MHILSPFPNRTLGAEISHKQTNESILRNILIASTVDYSKISCSPPKFLGSSRKHGAYVKLGN